MFPKSFSSISKGFAKDSEFYLKLLLAVSKFTWNFSKIFFESFETF